MRQQDAPRIHPQRGGIIPVYAQETMERYSVWVWAPCNIRCGQTGKHSPRAPSQMGLAAERNLTIGNGDKKISLSPLPIVLSSLRVKHMPGIKGPSLELKGPFQFVLLLHENPVLAFLPMWILATRVF